MSLFRTIVSSVVHIHLVAVEATITLYKVSPFLLGERGTGRAGRLSLLDIVKFHGPGSFVLAGGRSGLSVGFLVVVASFRVFLTMPREEGSIISFGHLHELG